MLQIFCFLKSEHSHSMSTDSVLYRLWNCNKILVCSWLDPEERTDPETCIPITQHAIFFDYFSPEIILRLEVLGIRSLSSLSCTSCFRVNTDREMDFL
jgi:hypothetical protein